MEYNKTFMENFIVERFFNEFYDRKIQRNKLKIQCRHLGMGSQLFRELKTKMDLIPETKLGPIFIDSDTIVYAGSLYRYIKELESDQTVELIRYQDDETDEFNNNFTEEDLQLSLWLFHQNEGY
jgi:hypothetical protein